MNYLATVTGKIGSYRISLLPNLVITIYFFFLRTRFCDELKDCRRPLKCHFFLMILLTKENILTYNQHQKYLRVKYMYLTIYLECLPRMNANVSIGKVVKELKPY